jgi:hypothetical protein
MAHRGNEIRGDFAPLLVTSEGAEKRIELFAFLVLADVWRFLSIMGGGVVARGGRGVSVHFVAD